MKFTSLIFFLVISYSACAQVSEVDRVWKIFEKGQVDEAAKRMKEISEKGLDGYDKRGKIMYFMNYGKIQITQKKYADALQNLLKAKDVNVNDSAKYEQMYMSAFGELFNSIGAFSLAIEYKKKMYQLNDDDFIRFLAANSIGGMFFQLEETDSALYYFKLQVESSRNLKNKIYYASSKNNIGLAYFQKKEYKNALANFYEAKKYSLKNKNTDLDFYNSVQENIGHCLFQLKDYHKAIDCLKEVHQFDLQQKRYLKQCFYQNLLVTAYLKVGDLEHAKAVEKSIIGAYSEMNTLAKYHFLSMQHELALAENQPAKAEAIFMKIKDIQKQNEREKKQAINNSNSIVAKYLISEARVRLAAEQKQKRNSMKALSLAKKEKSFITVLAISIFLFLLIGAFVLYQNLKNKQKKAQLEKEYLQLEEEKLKLKISFQERNLTEFAIDFSKNKEQNEGIIAQLRFLLTVQESNIKSEIQSILTQLKTRHNIGKRVEDLNENSEMILLHFRNKLQQLHPSLNKSDIELCALIKLNLSNKEIANFRNISIDSVKIFKNRLKKKLNIDSSMVLSDYLSNINS